MRLRALLFWLVLLVLLLPAALVTWARATQPTSDLGVRLVSFTPLALLAYGAAFVLVLVRVVVPGRGLRVMWLALALALLVPLGLHAWWYAPQVTGANPPPAAGAETLTVVTSNALGGGIDALDLVAVASDADADLLVVQEITPAALRTMQRGGLDERWPHRAGEPRDGLDGTMVFSRFELGQATRVETAMDSWQVEVDTPDGPLSLVALHAWPPTDTVRWRSDHRVIRAASRDADLIVGDFNATPDHAPMLALGEDGLRSVAELANEGWQPTWSTDGDLVGIPVPPLVQIDHVLIGDRLAALSTRTVDLDGSDHRTVVAEVARQ